MFFFSGLIKSQSTIFHISQGTYHWQKQHGVRGLPNMSRLEGRQADEGQGPRHHRLAQHPQQHGNALLPTLALLCEDGDTLLLTSLLLLCEDEDTLLLTLL